MWSLKFKVLNKDSIYTLLTNKYDVTDFFYPVDVYKKGKLFYILGIHLIEGDEKEKKRFANALKNHKKTINFEKHENMIIVLMKEEEKFYELIYDPSLYHPSPAIIKKGVELWSIASWERRKLENLMKEIERWKTKFSDFELLNLKQLNPHDIYFPRILPDIPEKQELAFTSALKHGYYNSPRKIDLVHLASMIKVSVSTFQENLRKAESKLLPFFAENIKFKKHQK
jgi:predicted DNA binding protein